MDPPRLLVAGVLLVDLAACRAFVRNEMVRLTGAEWTMLEMLVRARGRPVTREAALMVPMLYRGDRRVDQLVYNLRQVLPRDAHGEPLIRTVRGIGYMVQAGLAA